jgi:hypothetical protein
VAGSRASSPRVRVAAAAPTAHTRAPPTWNAYGADLRNQRIAFNIFLASAGELAAFQTRLSHQVIRASGILNARNTNAAFNGEFIPQ